MSAVALQIEPSGFEIDHESAREFVKEASKAISVERFRALARTLEKRQERMVELLSPDALPQLTEEAFGELAGMVFQVRRRDLRGLLSRVGLPALRAGLASLLYPDVSLAASGAASIVERFDSFLDLVSGIERERAVALASGLLHGVDPDGAWLSAVWVWSPDSGKGVLSLVTDGDLGIAGLRDGELYRAIGDIRSSLRPVAMEVMVPLCVSERFATDILLATVYSVYMYTLYKVKVSDSFDKFLPPLFELTSRVLGVRRCEVD